MPGGEDVGTDITSYAVELGLHVPWKLFYLLLSIFTFDFPSLLPYLHTCLPASLIAWFAPMRLVIWYNLCVNCSAVASVVGAS